MVLEKEKKYFQILKHIQSNLRFYAMIFALLFIWLLFGFLTHWIFFSPRNLSNLIRQMTIISFLAMGMVLVIVSGNIDLSVGSATGLVSMVTAYCQVILLPKILPALLPNMNIPTMGIIITIIAVFSGLITGIVIGAWQGLLIAYFRVPAFVITLGGMLIFRGAILGISHSQTIMPIENSYRLIAQGYMSKKAGYIVGALWVLFIIITIFWKRQRRANYGFEVEPVYRDFLRLCFPVGLVLIFILTMNSYRGIPNPVFLMLIVVMFLTYIINNTSFGRYMYAIGGNKEATRLSGVNIKATIFSIFIIMGLLTGFAGNVLTAYVAAGTIAGGTNYELTAIASCVIGGVSLMGGEGTIWGALIGTLIMASLENGMSVMNMEIFWQYIVKGLVLILAVLFDVHYKKKQG